MTSNPNVDTEHDEQLANLLNELADAVARGDVVDLDGVCAEHPAVADELRRLWSTVLLTDTVGAARTQRDSSDGLGPFQADTWQPIQLPSIVGDYEVVEEIGRGGMGVVFRARQISLDREVALKMILRSRLASEPDLHRFIAEASATARLDHPNIVPVFEVGDKNGRPYFSMQLVSGQTLADVVQQSPIEQRTAARIVSRVARAIHYAHSRGVLHRDVKPSNVMLTGGGSPLITDFGLAKQITAEAGITRTGMVVGTPAYMSPEQASGHQHLVGPSSDVYSLGCVLYFSLTGRPPFTSESPVELMMQVIEQEPEAPRTLVPGIDRDLETIVIRCLQKPVDLRYASAAALADDLDAYLSDERVSARSGRLSQVVARLFRETHHVSVLDNWGKLWIWHSVALLVICLLTWQLDYRGVENRLVYVTLWTIGLGAWALVFWTLRHRMGPVTFVERQIAHAWGASMIAIAMLFPIEWLLRLPVLTLSPLLGVISAMTFVIKAGMLTGTFYVQAAALLATSLAMAVWPPYAHLIFGIVSAGCFLFPGIKYASRDRSARAA